MRCSNCGATLPPTSQFCNSCGTQQATAPVAAPTATPYAQPAAPVYTQAPQRSGKRAGLWVAVLIGFLALAAGATVVGKKLWSASRNPTQLAQGQDPEARDFQQLPAGPGVQVPDGSGVTGASGQRPPKGGDVTGASPIWYVVQGRANGSRWRPLPLHANASGPLRIQPHREWISTTTSATSICKSYSSASLIPRSRLHDILAETALEGPIKMPGGPSPTTGYSLQRLRSRDG